MDLTDPLVHTLIGIVAFLAVCLLIACINALVLTRLAAPSPEDWVNFPLISVLAPARNEAENITRCIESVLAQDYPNFEVLVLDDHSTDGTGVILAGLAEQDQRLRVLNGQPLPPGWMGKNWACHQLSQAARGELLLFIDADTTHQPEMLGRSVHTLVEQNLDMLTALPRQEVLTWGERLVVPILYFVLQVFLPLPLAYRLRKPIFSAAIGQFLLFRREAYERIGGYAAVRGHGTDDLALARLVKQYALPWRLADGGEVTSTRMYRSFRQAYEGFSKNLFAAFDYRILPFLFAWLWMGYLFYRPPLELAIRLINRTAFSFEGALCLIAILESLILWGLVVVRFRFPGSLILAYLAVIGMGVWIAFRSVRLSLRGQANWKGRTLERPEIRWI